MGAEEHHHHHYYTDNSAVERIEKLRKEDEEKFQNQISKLESEKQDLKRFINDNVDSEKAKRLFKDLHIN